MSEDNTGNLEFLLRNIMDQSNKYNKDINERLEKLSNSINELIGQKYLIDDMVKKIGSFDLSIAELKTKVQALEIEEKRRAQVSSSITTPLIQKAIWTSLVALFVIVTGYSMKGIHFKSTEQALKMMGH